MSTSALSRVRALLLLLALCLGIAGQFAARAAMAAPMMPSQATHVSAAGSCAGCGGDANGMAPQCAIVSCAGMPGLPASGPAIERVEPAAFSLPATDTYTGLSPRPDPHPPRSFLPT